MMAAIGAATLQEARVLLVEKNERCGRKLLLTGNGRCNITNDGDLIEFLKHFSKNGEFLRDAFKYFFNAELIAFFQERGLGFITENEGRIFPKTEQAESVLRILEEELHKKNVELRYCASVTEILQQDACVSGVVLDNHETISSASVVLATGGLSYPQTGSTGDGFRMAEKLGHTVVQARPGLIGLVVEEPPTASLEGLTLHDINLQLSNGKKKIKAEKTDLLFTDYGISGPSVLNLSSRIGDWFRESGRVELSIDVVPRLTREEFEAWLLETMKTNAKKTIRNMLAIFLPERLIDVLLLQAEIAPEKLTNYIAQAERKRLVDSAKAMRFTITGPLSIEKAMITCGGVSLKEIDPRTMESRLIKKLYVAGEVLDIDADTGGFNLQAAFSTGYLAGMSVAKIKGN